MRIEIDNWKLMLLALYAGAVSGRGFNEVTAMEMELSEREFNWTLYVMQMRGVIEGCVFTPPRPRDKEQLMQVGRTELMLTPKGFEKVEAMLGAQSDGERLDEIRRLMGAAGKTEIARIIYNWINNQGR